MRRRVWLLVAAILGCCAIPVRAQNGIGLVQSTNGKALYDIHCASCHGADLNGTNDAPALRGVGAASVDFYLSTGRMPAAIGTQQAPPGLQPSFPRAQIDAITAYITSQAPGGPPIPKLQTVVDVQRGRDLYEANCQACHGVYGQGAIVGFGWYAPATWAATPLQIAEAVRSGPGMMPVFDSSEISDRDLGALVNYVDSLRTVTFDPGGWEIGRIGPVAEGFVAWILGLGSIVAFIRFIGGSI